MRFSTTTTYMILGSGILTYVNRSRVIMHASKLCDSNHNNHNNNKAIRDGKYLARPMPVLGNVHPIKIENVDIFFRDVISLLARVVILLIDTATQEVPMKNI